MNLSYYNLAIIFLLGAMGSSCGSSGGNNSGDIFLSEIPSPEVLPENSDSCISWNTEFSDDTGFIDKEVERIEIIPLEINDQCVIGSVSDIRLQNGNFIITDAGKAQGIFEFDSNGRFIRRLGAKGEDPDMYLSINGTDFRNDGFSILDWTGRKILNYDYDGNCVGNISMPDNMPMNFALAGGDGVIGTYASYFPERPFSLTWLTGDSIAATAFPFTDTRENPAANLLRANNNDIMYYSALSDTIYKVGKKDLTPLYKMGVVNERELKDFLAETADLDNGEFMRMKYSDRKDLPVNMVSLTETAGSWILGYQKGLDSYISVIGKQDNKARNYRRVNFKEKAVYFPFVPFGTDDRFLISCIDENLSRIKKDDMERIYDKVTDPGMRDLIENYDFENNNPLICKIWLK